MHCSRTAVNDRLNIRICIVDRTGSVVRVAEEPVQPQAEICEVFEPISDPVGRSGSARGYFAATMYETKAGSSGAELAAR